MVVRIRGDMAKAPQGRPRLMVVNLAPGFPGAGCEASPPRRVRPSVRQRRHSPNVVLEILEAARRSRPELGLDLHSRRQFGLLSLCPLGQGSAADLPTISRHSSKVPSTPVVKRLGVGLSEPPALAISHRVPELVCITLGEVNPETFG